MKLSRFRIKNYKVIDDTDWVPVNESVTALVGKNESGKTAILRAIWKSKNVAGAKFDKLLDYPRDRYASERKQNQEVCSIEFELTSEEIDALASQFPSDLLKVKPKKVTFTTSYKGEEETSAFVTFDDKTESRCRLDSDIARQSIQNLLDKIPKDASTESITKAADVALEQIKANTLLWETTTIQGLTSFQTAMNSWISADATRAALAINERGTLESTLARAKQGDPSLKARAWVAQNMPVFIYFDDYGQLETRIHLPTYIKQKDSADVKIRTQNALFEKSTLNPTEILTLGRLRDQNEKDEQVQRRKDKRRALLDSASFGLTGDWMSWWTEKRHKLHFDADGDDLVLKVSDEHNEFPIPFEERSHGFQWFFSFYLVFLVESEKAHKGAILLLDEPGLHLHPTLQSKLIGFFERISENNQLIYSTHLPFLVDGNHLDRVRTVHLAGPQPQKTVVSNDVRPTGDKDTLFPLQAAIGYSIAQTLFLGKRSVVVEGLTDYWILKAIDNCFGALKSEIRLHEDTILIPAGGTSRLMPLAAVMIGNTSIEGRQMLVLLDSDQEGKQAAVRVQNEIFGGDSSRVLLLGSAIKVEKATIEDIIPREVYVKALHESGYEFTLTEEEKKLPTTVAAMEHAFKRKSLGTFGKEQKVAAALKLIDAWGKDPKSLPESTREKAASLITAINGRFASTNR